MLRLYKADLTHDVTIPAWSEPPRPMVVPRARALARPGTRTTSAQVQFDAGIEPDRTFRFVSTEKVGLMEWEVATALMNLYEAGGGFRVDTDLIGPPGTPVQTFECLWDERTTPRFDPAANGQVWFMDFALRMREVA